MKKIIVLLVLAIILNAQVSISSNIGLNLSKLSGDDIQSVKGKVGFNLGLNADILLNPTFDLRSGLQFIKENYDEGKSSTLADHEDDMIKFEFSRLQIPVLLVFKQSENLRILIGPTMNFLSTAKKEAYDEEHSDGVEEFQNLKSFFSVKFGIQYNLSEKINAQIFYDNGLSTFTKDFDLKLSHTNLSIGYSF